jgi:hypothetical protein
MNINVVGVVSETLQEGSGGRAKKRNRKGLIKAIVDD